MIAPEKAGHSEAVLRGICESVPRAKARTALDAVSRFLRVVRGTCELHWFSETIQRSAGTPDADEANRRAPRRSP